MRSSFLNSQRSRVAVFLFLLGPFFGEILTGSAFPSIYFDPLSIISFHLFYGCGILLIREIMIRWKLSWGIIFLALAFGLFAEGIYWKSFFDPSSPRIHNLAHYGARNGIEWVAFASLVPQNAILSILLPLLFIDLAFPRLRGEPCIEQFGLWLLSILFLSAAAFGYLGFSEVISDFKLNAFYTLLLVAVVIILFVVAFLTRDVSNPFYRVNGPIFDPSIWALVGCIFTALNLWGPILGVQFYIPARFTFIGQLLLLIVGLVIGLRSFRNPAKLPFYHKRAVIVGTLGFWIISAFMKPENMMIVGIFAFGICFAWWRYVLRIRQMALPPL
jgi:hypothetical protein